MRCIQRFRTRTIALIGINLTLWVAAGLVLPRLLQEPSRRASSGQQPGFETAFQSVAGLNQMDGDRSSSETNLKYGISQALYDAWRYENQQPYQSIAAIDRDEVRAIYQHYWQRGNCNQYAAPLDIACLDSVLSFGIEYTRGFLTDLPVDPQSAALEVARRRESFRYQVAGGRYTDMRGGQHLLTEGVRRDRALAELAESYPADRQTELSRDLRRWLGGGESAAPSGEQSGDSSTPAIDRPNLRTSPSDSPRTPDEIYAQAKPFTVEVWIESSGIPAPAAGIVLTADGLILTNQHVVNQSDFKFVRLADGRDVTGTIVNADPSLDLALIQLEGVKGLPVAEFAPASTHVNLGDTVYAIGSPSGNHWQMTTAQIIQVQSDCGLANVRCLRTPEGFLKPGNSGGPLLDSFGQVIGVNRAIQQRTGEGVSIPVEVIQQYVEGRGA
ncbi:trypsin-like peptidase domain-containing protein [Egbenema bharatensis]|uniref:trypsin-like peptidase domain-containing protein n=1 Tax=Egbenema bharatensis TaxID=3463334 RepID=UPI003A8B5323